MYTKSHDSKNKRDIRPLSGIRVLDMTRVFSGPWGTQILGDLGADIIKVEHPERGDDQRKLGPPYLIDSEGRQTKESSYYLSVNRNKRSVGLNIKSAEGQEAIRRLAEKSDVFVENFKVDDLQRYGLDYKSISKINPRIIYCSISGFGQTGPRRNQVGYDTMIQAMSGLMSVTGHPGDGSHSGPTKVGIVVSDMMAGTFAAMAIQAALYARDTRNDSKGQYIDISMFDVQLAAMSHQLSHYLVSGEVPDRYGNEAPSVSPSGVFHCKDGKLVIVAGNDSQFKRLMEALNLKDAVENDPRFHTNAARLANRLALREMIEGVLNKHCKSYWIDLFSKKNLAAGPILDVQEAVSDPQAEAREMIRQVHHSSGQVLNLIASPMRFSETPLDVYTAPPTCGQHTDDVLNEILGVSLDNIKASLVDM